MPTLIGHAAPVLCAGIAAGRGRVPFRLLFAGLLCSILPDLDVFAFRFGVTYADILGHRGLSHSLLFAFCTGLAAALCARWLRAGRVMAFVVCGGAVLLHSLLDGMTNGGLGVALFWPYSEARYFLPWQPIEVSPFSPQRLLSARGLEIFKSEAVWIWLPSLAAGVLFHIISGRKKRHV